MDTNEERETVNKIERRVPLIRSLVKYEQDDSQVIGWLKNEGILCDCDIKTEKVQRYKLTGVSKVLVLLNVISGVIYFWLAYSQLIKSILL